MAIYLVPDESDVLIMMLLLVDVYETKLNPMQTKHLWTVGLSDTSIEFGCDLM